jgi:hypothetical protein
MVFLYVVSRSHSGTPHTLGLLWTSDQPDAETSTWQHTTLTTDKHPCPWRVSNPQSQQGSGHKSTPYTARPTAFDLFLYFPCIPSWLFTARTLHSVPLSAMKCWLHAFVFVLLSVLDFPVRGCWLLESKQTLRAKRLKTFIWGRLLSDDTALKSFLLY